MIKKTKKGCKVISHTGKNLGESKTMKGCKERLAEVEMFKHMKKKSNCTLAPDSPLCK